MMALVAEAAAAEAGIGKKSETPGINRSKSTLARDRWKMVNNHVKRKGSTFFGIDTEVSWRFFLIRTLSLFAFLFVFVFYYAQCSYWLFLSYHSRAE